MNSSIARRGFTLVELLVVIVIIGVIVALMLPAVRTSREGARRMSCSNNIKNLGLALQNYNEKHGHFPMAVDADRRSGWVALLPFIEQGNLHTQITGQRESSTLPPTTDDQFEPWQTAIPIFQCPSADSKARRRNRINYAFCIGDVAEEIHHPSMLRGAYAGDMTSTSADIKDGAAHTIALAEIGSAREHAAIGQFAIDQPETFLRNPSLCRGTLDPSRASDFAQEVPISSAGRGARWADGAAGCGLVNTILPPNSPSCAVGGSEAVDGIYSAGSAHGGGAMVVKVDGSVAFIAETIDAGDAIRAPPTPAQLKKGRVPSPYGIWGALGTAAGGDKAE